MGRVQQGVSEDGALSPNTFLRRVVQACPVAFPPLPCTAVEVVGGLSYFVGTVRIYTASAASAVVHGSRLILIGLTKPTNWLTVILSHHELY